MIQEILMNLRPILRRFPVPGIPEISASSASTMWDLEGFGFTLIELLLVISIIGTLAAMAVPAYINTLNNARNAKAIGDIRAIENDIAAYEAIHGEPPATLDAVSRGDLQDPWRSSYVYLKFIEGQNQGEMRKDRFLVPLNSTYDLYSKGKDGESKPPLTASTSWDDIIRASDGAYVGLASGY